MTQELEGLTHSETELITDTPFDMNLLCFITLLNHFYFDWMFFLRNTCEDEGIKIKMGFFLHIPFPTFDIIRIFPWVDEILMGMLGTYFLNSKEKNRKSSSFPCECAFSHENKEVFRFYTKI